MARDLTNLTIAITGGARGIGAATAERLKAAGADVIIGDRDVEVLAATASQLGVRSHPLDVTDAASWRDFAAAAGAIDVLVNNAGIMPIGPLLQEDDAVTRAVIDINLHGMIAGTKTVAPGMRERGSGQIVNVASAMGRVATAEAASYTASKFAIVGFSEATRLELAPMGIEVSLVMPTVVRTELAAGIRQAKGIKKIGPEDVAEVIELMIRKPRPEMWVPRWTQPVTRMTGLLPKRAQQFMTDRFDGNVVAERDEGARSAYEAGLRE